MNEYTLTKQVSKHGNQAVIILPKILEKELPPKTLVEIRIKVLKQNDG